MQTTQVKKQIFTVSAHKGLSHFITPCEEDEFPCNYPSDGCISWDKVYDGKVDCIRDGHDEDIFLQESVAASMFYKGNYEKSICCGLSLRSATPACV